MGHRRVDEPVKTARRGPASTSTSAALLLPRCSAMAQKVKFTPLSAKERFTALQSGEIDILSRNTTWTMGRDTSLGLVFAGVTYYDGQGFMVKKSLGVDSASSSTARRFAPRPAPPPS
jgi:ABC-type amino acid transport substrate-binding protein